jgi:hypothetical protein
MASAEATASVRPAAATGDHFYFLSLALTVENVGKVLARAPYLTVGPESFFTEVMGGAIVRKTVSGRKGFYGTLDDVVHVDDETSLAFGPIGLRLRGLGPQDFAKWFVLNALEKRDSDAFLVNIGKPSSSREAVLPVEDVTFGAANALPKVERIAVTKLDVLTQFAAANGWT